MTEEDSDDDNDRMERANRIREMREGRRHDAPEDADDHESERTAAESVDAESADDSGSADESDMDADPEPTETPETADGPESAAESETDGEPRTPTDSRPADDSNAADESEMSVESETEMSAGEVDDESVDEGGFKFAGDDETDADGDTAVEADTEEKAEPAAATEQATVESGVANPVTDTDAAAAVDNLGAGGTFAIPDQATTVTEKDEQAILDEAEQSVAAARAAVASRGSAHATDRTRVLEFDLGGERFCLDIDYIEEIVELENMTRVPNSPSYVEGVVDLRGQVTAIINPKDALDVENDSRGELIIVFDPEELSEQGNLGWIVDDVRQVTPVSEEEVNESPEDEDEDHINGIINREDEDDFIVWTTPELALNSS